MGYPFNISIGTSAELGKKFITARFRGVGHALQQYQPKYPMLIF